LYADESQQNQAIALRNKGCGFFASEPQMVSDSPKLAPEWLDSATFLPSAINDIGTRECYFYRNKIFKRHPYLANALANQYIKIYHDQNLREANLFIGRIDKVLIIHDLNLSDSVSDIKAFCEKTARQCHIIILKLGNNQKAYDKCKLIAKRYQIHIDDFDGNSPFIPTLNKLSCKKWWYRQVNKLRLQITEQVLRKLNLVNKQRSCYASEFALQNRITQLQNSFDYLSSNSLVNDDGQELSLLDIYNKSVSNPRIRKAELMTRIRGFEEVATEMGHAGEFYTLTAPSRMHAVLSSGKQNPKFDGSTPNDVNAYFNDNWKLIRSALSKRNIQPYGFRVVEPHHDGTPHWHLLLFMHPSDVKKTRFTIEKYALKVDGNEKGAKQHRFKAISIDPNKGSASGYIAKYISKSIDGSDIDQDLYGNQAKVAATKIDAWSSTWNIRQFQQIGGPSVTVWRELRRLKNSDNPDIVPAFTAADAGDWAAYVMAMGGAMLPRRNRPIHPFYETKTNDVIDTETGEVTQSNLTIYGDQKAPSIIGLICNNIIDKTHTRIWKKLMKPMTTCGTKHESSNKELAKILWRDPRKREAPEYFLGLV